MLLKATNSGEPSHRYSRIFLHHTKHGEVDMRFLMPVILVASLMIAGSAGAGELAVIKDLDLDDIESRFFSLGSRQEVTVEAVAFRTDRSAVSDAWILDSRSREVVWELSEAERTKRRSKIAEYEDKFNLPAGEYELYFATFPASWGNNLNILNVFKLAFDGTHRWHDLDDYVDDLEIVVSADNGTSGGNNRLSRVEQLLTANTIAAIIGTGDDAEQIESFELERDMKVNIYAIGEAKRKETYDGAWLEELSTGKRVWEFRYRDTRPAGGAKKNRVARETLDLEAGRYALYYMTDDSHSWPRFNMAPPRDPMAWGVTIRPADEGDLASVKTIEYESPLDRNVIAQLTRVRDNHHESKGFTLTQPLEIRVFAIGEGGRREMYDYGWISDARTREVIWEMKGRDTKHAGGDDKNRAYDQIHKFEPGSYVVHFVTDGSHSYRDWNASAPFMKSRYGITLTAIGDGDLISSVTEYNPKDDPSILAQINQVGNRDYESERFVLSDDQNIHIYALGEGERREMFDYAWIEDDRGHTVWEMTYRKTDHAGGAKKNRMFNDTVQLDAGEYELFYESDGSHSYRHWNDSPPRDPQSWGVVVSATE
jgi:hypothetical protein